MEKPILTLELLVTEAQAFCLIQSKLQHKELYGVTDGKAVGTLIEHAFKKHLHDIYSMGDELGSSANGLDVPYLNLDIKVTSIKQPQSSCPYKDAKQKIFGLGYNLLVFVYDKKDDPETSTALLNFVSCSYVASERTADYTMTHRLREMVMKDNADIEDIMAYLTDRNIPADELTIKAIAEKVKSDPPAQGYLTISNALQWRLQYGRIVNLEKDIPGIHRIVKYNKPQ